MFSCFLIEPSENRLRGTYEVLLNSGSVVHSRNVTWTRLLPPVPVSAGNKRFVYASRKGRKLDPSRHGVMEADEDVYYDEPRSPPAFGRESWHWLLQFTRLSH